MKYLKSFLIIEGIIIGSLWLFDAIFHIYNIDCLQFLGLMCVLIYAYSFYFNYIAFLLPIIYTPVAILVNKDSGGKADNLRWLIYVSLLFYVLTISLSIKYNIEPFSIPVLSDFKW